MTRRALTFASYSILIAIFVLLVGFVIVRPVLAQDEATTTDQIADATTPVDTVASSDAPVTESNPVTIASAENSTSTSSDTSSIPDLESVAPSADVPPSTADESLTPLIDDASASTAERTDADQ